MVKIVNDANEGYPLGFFPQIPIEEGGRFFYPLGDKKRTATASST